MMGGERERERERAVGIRLVCCNLCIITVWKDIQSVFVKVRECYLQGKKFRNKLRMLASVQYYSIE